MYYRIFGDFPAKNTVYTPYIYGSGQTYIQRVSITKDACSAGGGVGGGKNQGHMSSLAAKYACQPACQPALDSPAHKDEPQSTPLAEAA